MAGISPDPKPARAPQDQTASKGKALAVGNAVLGRAVGVAWAAGARQACEQGEAGAGGSPQQKMMVVCEVATASARRVLSPPVSDAHVGGLLGELGVEETEASCGYSKRAGYVSSPAPAALFKGGELEAGCKSLVLTVQVKANGKLLFFEGQGPAATLLAQAEMAYGSGGGGGSSSGGGGGGGGGGGCPGTLLPFISLLDSETVCEVLSDSECSAPPILDSGTTDRGNAKALHMRAASVLAGPHAFPAVRRRAHSRCSYSCSYHVIM